MGCLDRVVAMCASRFTCHISVLCLHIISPHLPAFPVTQAARSALYLIVLHLLIILERLAPYCIGIFRLSYIHFSESNHFHHLWAKIDVPRGHQFVMRCRPVTQKYLGNPDHLPLIRYSRVWRAELKRGLRQRRTHHIPRRLCQGGWIKPLDLPSPAGTSIYM